ncbi:extracellular matrix protein 2 [Megalops cyprinoides]|uniref:extracellular matrix protein 2 n=1 Tax=Megalops cyprinoides TaxID=118141 RepID=UPI001863B83F|nr:extracellular matrix protein 2 [Megalops cyprinoides]
MYGTVLLCLCACTVAAVANGKLPTRRGPEERSTRDPAAVALDTPVPGRTLPPGSGGQCLVNGIYLFEGSVWSPEPCSVCLCQSGVPRCRSTPCANDDPLTPKSPAHGERGPPRKVALKAGMKARRRADGRGDGSGRLQLSPAVLRRNVAEAKHKQQETGSVTVKEVSVSVSLTKRVATIGRKQEAGTKVEMPKVVKAGKPPLAKGREAAGAVDSSAVAVKKTQSGKKQKDDDDDDEDDEDEDDDDEDEEEEEGKEKECETTPPPERFPSSVFNRTGFMESLPAGCLLSESLIACGSVGMAHLPIITDLGVKTLYLADNKISKLPPRGLAGLPNLEWLDLSKNKLEDSSLSIGVFRNLTKLKRINLDGNNLTKIPRLPTSLEELKINDNKIRSLTPHSFKGLSKLLTLELEGNGFHDGNVSPLAFRPLRVIIYLRLDKNKFRAIPSGLPPSLQELHLSENRVEEVHEGILNKTVELKVLDLSHNRIREDRIAPRAWIHLPKLEALDLSHNKLVHVPSFLPTALRQLTLHHNQIERIPGYVFGHLRPGLESLNLSHNRLTADGIHGVSFLGLYRSLTELLLDHNRLRSVPRGLLLLKSLQLLRLNHNLIRYVPMNSICDTRVSEDSPLVSVHLENNLINRRLIPPTAFSCIKSYHSVLLRPQAYEEEE